MYSELHEPDLKRMCIAADWRIKWDSSYFLENRKYDADIFYDLLEPQHYGFLLDKRYVAEDVLAGAASCLPLDVGVVEERFTLRTLRPYNIEKSAYRTAILGRGDTHASVVYREEEPDYLLHEVLRIAGYDNKMFVNIASYDEDAYWFVLLPSNVSPELLHPMTFNMPTTTSTARMLADTTHPARARYTYTPLFTSSDTEQSDSIDVLLLDRSPAPPSYTLPVQTGQTLYEAVKKKLASQFHYTDAFKLLDYRVTDTPAGQASRLLVHIATAKFATDHLLIHNATPHWQAVPTMDIYRKHRLGFGLHTRAIE